VPNGKTDGGASFAVSRTDSFALHLADSLREIADPAEIMWIAASKLAIHLGAGQAAYTEIDPTGEFAIIERDWNDGSMASNAGRHRLEAYGATLIADLRAGKTVAIGDVSKDSRTNARAARDMFAEVGVASLLVVPLVKAGKLVATLALHHRAARRWSGSDMEAAEATAERTWAAVERARAEKALGESERRLRRIFDAIDEGYCVCEIIVDDEGRAVDYRFLEVNPLFETMSGLSNAVGRTASELVPGLEAHWAETYGRAALGGETLRFESGSQAMGREFNVFATPVEPHGCFALIFTDITERKREEADRIASEARFRLVVEQSPDGIFVADSSGRYIDVNPAGEKMLGYTRAEILSLTLTDVLAPEEVPRLAPHFAKFTVGMKTQNEWGMRRKDGSVFRAEITGLRLPDGGSLGAVRDVTERRAAEERLRRSHDTYLKLIKNIPFGVLLVDADFRLAEVSLGARKAFSGIEPLIGRDFAEILRIVWPEPFASEVIGHFRDTLATGEPYVAGDTTERRNNTDQLESYDWKLERVNLPDGSFGIVGYFYDVSERIRQEEQVRLLMHEVNHRSKNILSVVQAVARSTARSTAPDFVERFDLRIRALAASHDLLLEKAGRSIPLDELVRTQIGHLEHLIGSRIRLGGPEVMVGAAAVQTLGMVLHELSTNALKYGALSGDAGEVEVSWELGGVEDDVQFAMSWKESGGPEVAPPSRKGFGSTVIDTMARLELGGEVEIDYAPAGLTWRLACKADRLLG